MKKFNLLPIALLFLGIGSMEAQYTVLHNFNGANGSQPYGSLTSSGNRLYGATNAGGLHDSGCVFSIDTNGGNYKDIFDFNGTNGSGPAYGSLALSGNKLYGMTNQGGLLHYGCVYSIDTNGLEYKDILDFNAINGKNPIGTVIINGSELYGISQYGGTHDSGCVFSIDTNGNKFKDLLDFNGANGQFPRGSLLLSGGVLFGMVNFGAAPHGEGRVFSLDTNGSKYKDLLDFTGVVGKYPYGDLILSGSVLFGMTSSGGINSDGNIFSLDTNGNEYKNIFSFNGANGNQPNGDLVMSASGVLYGMTTIGGAHDSGCIFSVDTTGLGYIDLFDFNKANGTNPYGSLSLVGTELFGTTTIEGANNDGVIFRFKDLSLGVAQLNVTTGRINVYPNPNTGNFTLTINYSEHVTLEVYNMLGLRVYNAILRQVHGDNLIDLSNQPNGLYLYRVQTQAGILAGEGKFIIQK